MYKIGLKKLLGIFLTLIFLGVMAGTAPAKVFDLCTGQTTITMPGGEIIPVWGFGIDIGGTCPASVPGPVLDVPAGDPGLTINLRNTLPDPVSLNIAGQMLSPNNGPVWSSFPADTETATGNRTAGDVLSRVRSFAHEAAAVGGTATYIWPNFRVGSYLLTSGTNPAKQVQMGLYLVVKKDSAAGEAYAGVFYDKEIIMLYSEVDPLMHAAINAGTYGPGGTITSSLHRDPKYFLINGTAFEPDGGLDPINAADPVNAGDSILIRFLNAGYETHVPQLLNMYMDLVAEDGNPYVYPKKQYGVQLPAGKTMDAVISMPDTIGRFSIHDAAHHLTNNGTPDMGGMLAFVSTAPCPGDIHPLGAPDGDVDGLDLFELTQNTGLAVLSVFAENFGRLNCP